MKPETVEAVARTVCRAEHSDMDEKPLSELVDACWRVYEVRVTSVLVALTTTPEYQALVKDAERKECFWTSDGDDSPWEGTCGVAWIFIDGGPEENQMAYCPQCGGKLTAQTYDEMELDDAAIDAARAGE